MRPKPCLVAVDPLDQLDLGVTEDFLVWLRPVIWRDSRDVFVGHDGALSTMTRHLSDHQRAVFNVTAERRTKLHALTRAFPMKQRLDLQNGQPFSAVHHRPRMRQ